MCTRTHLTVKTVALTNAADMGSPHADACAVKLAAAASRVAWNVVAHRRGMYSQDQTRSTSSPSALQPKPMQGQLAGQAGEMH